MPFTDQPLYRAGALEPVAGYNQVLMIADQAGPITKYGTPFYGIRGIRPVRGLGPHGVTLLWAQAAAPAGYTPAPSGMPTGAIAAGGAITYPNPPPLQMGPQQLLQWRWSVRSLAIAGPVIDDLDFQVYQPNALPMYGTVNAAPGAANAADQFQEPSDAAAEPAQGANSALPAVFPQANPADQLNLSEGFIWENNGPTFKIVNNGIATTGGALGIRVWGFLFDLTPLTSDGTWVQKFVMGAWRSAPQAPIVVVPTAPATGASPS